MKRKLLLISGIVLLAITILANAIISTHRSNVNGFKRRFENRAISRISDIVTENPLREIAGATDMHIYMSDLVPGKLHIYTFNLKQKGQYQLPIPREKNLVPLFYTSFDSPHLIILAGNIPAIIQSDLDTPNASIIYTNIGRFDNAISIGNDNFIFKCFDTGLKDALLKKINLRTKKTQTENGLSEIASDGGFQFDGILNYDPLSHLFAYVCSYCNHVTCFDTSLNLIYRSKTIDTINTSTVRSELIEKKGSRYFTMAKPPRYVNKSTSAYNGLLFINSVLKSDNEQQKSFDKNFVIDVYNLQNGSYKCSFYIPSLSDKLSAFKVINGNVLVALYKKHIATYRVNFSNLKDSF